MVQYSEALTVIDQQVFQESAAMLSATLARARASQLLTLPLGSARDPLAGRKLLLQLAEEVRSFTDANVVVLYEFQGGRPLQNPVIAGPLDEPEYLSNKTIVIEEPNPLLAVARLSEPDFLTDARLQTMSEHPNRHGDKPFAAREHIRSSVGLPLMNVANQLIGVIFVNYRQPQKFDEKQIRVFKELFEALPSKLERLQLFAMGTLSATQQARQVLLERLHGSALQQVIAAAGFLNVVKTGITARQSDEELVAKIDYAKSMLTEAETAIRSVVLELQEMDGPGDVRPQLEELRQRLYDMFGSPEDLRLVRTGTIPPRFLSDLLPILEEAILNAAKHGKADTVVVTASRTKEGLLVVVSDNGKGFDPSTVPPGEGTQVMQARAASLHGEIEIGSKPGAGADCFDSDSTQHRGRRRYMNKQIKVLFVDDIRFIRQSFEEQALTPQNQDILTAAAVESEAEALELLGTQHFDVAVIDMQLPRVPGGPLDNEAGLRIIKASAGRAGAPRFLAISGVLDEPDFILRARDAGAAGYFLKRSDGWAELFEAIRKINLGRKVYPRRNS